MCQLQWRTNIIAHTSIVQWLQVSSQNNGGLRQGPCVHILDKCWHFAFLLYIFHNENVRLFFVSAM